jgi:hypothetical protein
VTRAEIHCPSFHDHTPSPEGYIQWHAWAKSMSKTHRQVRCTGCGRWSIWVEKREGKGGPTKNDPGRPYCKPDQSCCDFVCGN